MQQVISFISEHWAAISLALLVATNVLNAASRHWSEHAGLAKALLFCAEMLSIVRSRGVPAGALGPAKLPLQSVPPSGDANPPAEPLVMLLAFVALLAAACATTGGQKPTAAQRLEQVQNGVLAAQALAVNGFHVVCGSIADACIDEGITDPARCRRFLPCLDARNKAVKLLKAAHLAVIEAAILIPAGDAATAEAKLSLAAQALSQAWALLHQFGIADALGR